MLRLSPPLTIEETEVERLVEVTGEAFDACREPGTVLERMLRTVAARGLDGFPFPGSEGA